MLERIAAHSYDHPWRTLLSVLLLTALFMIPMQNFRFDTEFESFLPGDADAVRAGEVLRSEFGSQAFELLLIQAHYVTDPEALREMRRLEEALLEEPVVIEVIGLTTMLEAEGRPEPWTDWDKLEPALLNARDLPEWRGVVSSTGLHSLMRVRVDDEASTETVVSQVRAVVDSFAGEEIYVEITGMNAVRHGLARVSARENGRLFALALVAMGTILYVNFRRLSDVLILSGIVTLALLWAMGAFFALGLSFTVISISATPLVLGLGIDYGLHYLNRYYEERSKGVLSGGALRSASRGTGYAILLTAATTLIGFASFMVTGFPPIEQFGILSALGVASAALLTVVVLPAIYRLRDGRRHDADRARGLLGRSGGITGGVVEFLRFPKLVAGFVVISLGVVLLSIPQIKTGSVPTTVDTEAQRTLDRVASIFGHRRNVTLLVPRSVAVSESEMESLFIELETVGVRVFAPWFPLVEGDAAIERDAGTGWDRDWVSSNYARVSLDYRSQQRPTVIPDVKEVVDEAPFDFILAGRDVATAEIEGRVAAGLQRSMSFTLPAIFLLLAIGLRSVLLAAVALTPLLLVVLWKLGLMPLLDIRLSVTTATTAALVIGIGIDFSIHITHRLRAELRAGVAELAAIERTLATAGRAILGAALTTTVAFVILGSSQVNDLREYGLLTAMAILLSLIACLTVVPLLAAPALRRITPSNKRADRGSGSDRL